jgi:hypothetical protein
MSTDAHKELEEAGGKPDPLDSSSGPLTVDGEGESNGSAPDWLEGVDDELREWATSKGIKDPVEALKHYRGAEKGMNEAQRAAAQMEGRVAELMERSQAADQGQGPQLTREEQEIATYVERAASLYDEGKIETQEFAYAMMNAGRAQARLDTEASIGQRVAPVEQKQASDSMTAAARELSATYDDFEGLSDEVMGLINKNPQLYASPEGMRAAYGLVKAGKDREAAAEARKAAKTETLTDSSRSDASAQEASAAIIAELDAVRSSSARDPLG